MYGLYYCRGGINSFGTLQSHKDRIWLACFETISHRDRKTCCLSPAATVDDLGVSGVDESLEKVGTSLLRSIMNELLMKLY